MFRIIRTCLIYFFLGGYGLGMGWIWEGGGNIYGGFFFIGFKVGWKGGMHSDFAYFTVQPFMCLAPESQTQERDLNVSVFKVCLMYVHRTQ